jgi:flavin reductase (DIM6/NTAB) family NADH-FMN oxidoreductase RutF
LKTFPLAKVYQLVEPGPVVLLSTSREGRPNVMTMSWLMPIEFSPPQVACVVSNRNFSFKALTGTRECVIAIPAARLARKVVAVGNCSGRDVDKFDELGLTTVAASKVSAPLIRECYANLECRVVDGRLVRKYCLFILEVVKAWVDPAQKNPRMLHHRGEGVFAVDGRVVKLPSRMA